MAEICSRRIESFAWEMIYVIVESSSSVSNAKYNPIFVCCCYKKEWWMCVRERERERERERCENGEWKYDDDYDFGLVF